MKREGTRMAMPTIHLNYGAFTTRLGAACVLKAGFLPSTLETRGEKKGGA